MSVLRSLFVILIDRHPCAFRERFKEEFLDIFEQSEEPRTQSRLVADAFVSLARQWGRVATGSQRIAALSPAYAHGMYADLTAGPGISRLAQALFLLLATGVVWTLLSHHVRLAKPLAQTVVTVTIR